QATGQPTYTKTVNDVWGLGSDISSPLYVPIIGAKLNCWPLHCNYASVTIPAPVGSSCAHPLCSTGVPLTSSCSSCAAAVCSHHQVHAATVAALDHHHSASSKTPAPLATGLTFRYRPRPTVPRAVARLACLPLRRT